MCFAGTEEIRLYEGVYDEAQKNKLVNFMKCLYNDAVDKPNWSHDSRLEPFMKKIFVRMPGAYYEMYNVDFLTCANLKLCGTFIQVRQHASNPTLVWWMGQNTPWTQKNWKNEAT